LLPKLHKTAFWRTSPDDWSQEVTPHYFVAVERQVYDFSIRFKTIKGVYPDCILPTSVSLSDANLVEFFRNGHGIHYLRQSSHRAEDYVSVTSKTPYREWLTANSVNHRDFWLAASTVTAAILEAKMMPILPNEDKLAVVRETFQSASRLNL